MRAHLVAFLLMTMPAVPASAQMLRGTVREASTGASLHGVFVTLRAADGSVSLRALSDTLGRFYIQPPNGGKYTVRVERIGYQTATRDVVLTTGAAVDVAVAMNINPLRLREIAVTRERRCTNSQVAARETAAVWEEARKALAVAAWLEKDAGAKFHIRVADELVTLNKESTQYPVLVFDSIRGRSSFRSMSADSLLDTGFATFTEHGNFYYGPDAELLVSPRFVAAHCFSIERRPDRAGLIGLAFEPVPETNLPDISGALWIDEQTGALRFIEYEYVKLPLAVRRQYAGGRVNVRQLPNGAFVVESYRIHMPQVRYLADGGIDVQNLHQRTGEVLDISVRGEKIALVPRFTVRGVVFDSLRARPLANVRFGVRGTPFNTVTDNAGRFTFEQVPRGRYAVAIDDTTLVGRPQPRAVGFEVHAADVDVTISLPSRDGLIAAMCPADPRLDEAARRLGVLPARVGVLELRMVNADGSPWIEDQPVVELVFFNNPTGFERGRVIRSMHGPDRFGVITACGLAVGKAIEVNLIQHNDRNRVSTVVIPSSRFFTTDLKRH